MTRLERSQWKLGEERKKVKYLKAQLRECEKRNRIWIKKLQELRQKTKDEFTWIREYDWMPNCLKEFYNRLWEIERKNMGKN